MSTKLKILLVSALVTALLGVKATTARTSNDKIQVTPADPLDLYIERLAYAESGGRENIQIIDSNGKWSRGCLQFQDDTWKRYSAKYGIKADIMDCPAQKRLARAILLEPGGFRNWLTSAHRIGLPPV